MNCEDYQELISAWIDDELSSFEEKSLIEHLDICPNCRSDWKYMANMQNPVNKITDPDIPSKLFEQIMSKIDESIKKQSSDRIVLLPTAYGRMIPTEKGEENAKILNVSSHYHNKQTG